MRAILLVGHGSLRSASGAAMIRLAARAQEAGLAPLVAAGFLNYSRPTFAEALARCVAAGAHDLTVQPYFLVPGKFVREDVPGLLAAGHAAHPGIALRLADPFGDHPALAELVAKRAAAAGAARDSALLLMAHGSPFPESNAPIFAVAERLRASRRFSQVLVSFLDLNEPSIDAAIDQLAAGGWPRIVAAPYFLQLGGHVAEDLPELISAARQRHPAVQIALAEHLGYDRLLLDVIADRAAAAQRRQPAARSYQPV